MRFTVMAFVLLVAIQSYAGEHKSWWQRLFEKPKVVKIQKHVHRKSKKGKAEKEKPAEKEREKSDADHFFIVDAQWMADYWLQTGIWDYSIPEESKIVFEGGNYKVPPVVYRHYEDMSKATKSVVNP